MIRIYCRGKKAVCNDDSKCASCKHFGGNGTELIEVGMTNFDRIKNMSVEEMATFICGIYDNDEDLGKFINGTLIPAYNENDIKEWLEREVEDDKT